MKMVEKLVHQVSNFHFQYISKMTSNPHTDSLKTVGYAELLSAKISNPLTQFFPPIFSCEDMFSHTYSAVRVSDLDVGNDTKNP